MKKLTFELDDRGKVKTMASNGDMSGAMEKKLREMKEAWNKGKEESKKSGGGGTTLKPGDKYICRLSKAQLREGDRGPFVVFEFTCVDGDQVGEKGVIMDGLDSDERIVFLQRDLRRLGQEVDDFDITELPAKLAELEQQQPAVRLKVMESKPDGKYINCFIEKMLNLDGDATVSGEDDAQAAPPPARGAAPRPAPRAAAPPATGRFAGAAPAPAARPAPGPAKAAARPATAPAPAPARVANPAPVAVEEPAEEEPAPISEGEMFAAGDKVGYVLKSGARATGVVNKVLPDGDTIHIRDDATQKLIAAKISVNQVSALIDTGEEEAVAEA